MDAIKDGVQDLQDFGGNGVVDSCAKTMRDDFSVILSISIVIVLGSWLLSSTTTMIFCTYDTIIHVFVFNIHDRIYTR